MKTDLHTHSTASDGTLKPAELVTLADSCGVKLLALTDHDTVDGLPEAKSEAVKHGITFVPGIEVSTLWNERSIHVVGLGIRYEDGSASGNSGSRTPTKARSGSRRRRGRFRAPTSPAG